MAVETTTYRVETIYDVTDKASKALLEVGAAAEKAGRQTETLKAVLLGLGAERLLSKAFDLGKRSLIDFNAEVEKSKISLATVTAMNLSAPFALARQETDKLFERFQVMAAQSPATTKEFINMANSISSGVMQAGLGIKGLERITAGAITASSALGAPAEMLALDVTQMLAGTVAIRDRYARQLLSGIGESDYHKFNSYTATKRATLVQKSFEQDSLKDASKAFGESFVGVTSTLKDNFEIGLGRVGLPLFKAVTAEVKSWNDWMSANKNKIDLLGKSVSDGLVTGFRYAKSAAEFLVAHAGTIMEIGKIWAITKIAGGVGGSLGGAFTGAAGSIGGVLGEQKVGKVEKAIKDYGDKVGLYHSYGAGLAISKAGGLAGAAGSIGLGGALQLGVISHELGEYLGVHRAITKVIDPQKVEYDQLIDSIRKWDKALAESRDKLAGRSGAQGTTTYANAVGAASQAQLTAETMKDAYRILKGSHEQFDPFGNWAGQRAAKEKLESGGMDSKQVAKFMGSSPAQQGAMVNEAMSRASQVQSQADLAREITDREIKSTLAKMSADERALVESDLVEPTQRVMEMVHRALGNGHIDDLNFLFYRSALLGDKSPLAGYQAKAPVTNIKIDRVEVAAKDPDRWIAELDAKARSMVRAPREARGSVRRGNQ